MAKELVVEIANNNNKGFSNLASYQDILNCFRLNK